MKRSKRDPSERFQAGQSVRFNGESADRTVTGSLPVKVVNPWSNRDKVTHTDNRGQPYEGAGMHIPTATVERAAGKSALDKRPARQFEAYHHTLSNVEGSQAPNEAGQPPPDVGEGEG